jgi:hypothetical protein
MLFAALRIWRPPLVLEHGSEFGEHRFPAAGDLFRNTRQRSSELVQSLVNQSQASHALRSFLHIDRQKRIVNGAIRSRRLIFPMSAQILAR